MNWVHIWALSKLGVFLVVFAILARRIYKGGWFTNEPVSASIILILGRRRFMGMEPWIVGEGKHWIALHPWIISSLNYSLKREKLEDEIEEIWPKSAAAQGTTPGGAAAEFIARLSVFYRLKIANLIRVSEIGDFKAQLWDLVERIFKDICQENDVERVAQSTFRSEIQAELTRRIEEAALRELGVTVDTVNIEMLDFKDASIRTARQLKFRREQELKAAEPGAQKPVREAIAALVASGYTVKKEGEIGFEEWQDRVAAEVVKIRQYDLDLAFAEAGKRWDDNPSAVRRVFRGRST